MGWVKGEIDGNHDVQSTFKYDYSWLASLFLGSKVSEMVWVKGSIELRKHMMIFALGWEISCIHITRLSNSCHIFVKKQNPSYFIIRHCSSLFLSIFSNPFQFAALIFLNQPTQPTSALPYPTRKRGRTQGSIKKGENFITPNLEDAVERDDTTMTTS